MRTLDDHLIADYIEDLRRELQTSPETEREILLEVRSHLWHAAQEGEDAARTALERFGQASEIGRELRQVHGCATWQETVLAALPVLLLGTLAAVPLASEWIAMALIAGPAAYAVGRAVSRQTRLPLWSWTWLGCVPLAIPNAPPGPLWGALAYLVVLLLVRNRNWLEGTLALYPLPTLWAFHRTVLAETELQLVGWSTTAVAALSVGVAALWAVLLARTLRTPSGQRRIARALASLGIASVLNVLTVVAARLWPTYPYAYPYTVGYFALVTIPYALYRGLPYLLYTVLAAVPAVLALLRARARGRPPSRPVLSD